MVFVRLSCRVSRWIAKGRGRAEKSSSRNADDDYCRYPATSRILLIEQIASFDMGNVGDNREKTCADLICGWPLGPRTAFALIPGRLDRQVSGKPRVGPRIRYDRWRFHRKTKKGI
jgi:hypothetical protein